MTATHDVDLLLRVIVETMVEATGADGGVVLGRKGELARVGDPEAGAGTLDLPLTVGGEHFGKVALTGTFDQEQRDTASSLAAQAAVALENAQLHTIVERQALVDPLTGLANRRSLEESLQDGALARVAASRATSASSLPISIDSRRSTTDTATPRATARFACSRRRCTGAVREVDSAGRWGGEEFALILPGTDLAGGVARRRACPRDARRARDPLGRG